MKFLKLTSAFTKQKYRINFDHIVVFKEINEYNCKNLGGERNIGKTAIFDICTDEPWIVKETPDEIDKMLEGI